MNYAKYLERSCLIDENLHSLLRIIGIKHLTSNVERLIKEI